MNLTILHVETGSDRDTPAHSNRTFSWRAWGRPSKRLPGSLFPGVRLLLVSSYPYWRHSLDWSYGTISWINTTSRRHCLEWSYGTSSWTNRTSRRHCLEWSYGTISWTIAVRGIPTGREVRVGTHELRVSISMYPVSTGNLSSTICAWLQINLTYRNYIHAIRACAVTDDMNALPPARTILSY